jgi:hypothetical protein
MSPTLLAYLMLERSMEALQDDVSQEERYDAILSAMDSLWWMDLTGDEHDALNDDLRSVVQAHVVHEGV